MDSCSYKKGLQITGLNSFEFPPEEKDGLPSIETAVNQFTAMSKRKRRAQSARRITVSVPSQNDVKCQEITKMRYTHGIQEDTPRMSEDHFQSMTLKYHGFELDSVDAVFDANKPMKSFTERERTKIAEVVEKKAIGNVNVNTEKSVAWSEQGKKENENNIPNEIRRTKSAMCMSADRSRTPKLSTSSDDIEKLCAEDFLKIDINLDDLINGGKDNTCSDDTNGQSSLSTQRRKRKPRRNRKKKSETESTIQLPITTVNGAVINPDIHRNVYIQALQDARAKYFRRTYPGLSMTEAYKFSYFDVCNKIEEHKERFRREKDFRNYVGMKRIFGDIRLDDYYSAKFGFGNK